MEQIEHKPIIKTLKLMINLALGLEVAMLFAVTAIFFITITSPEDKLISTWPVEVGSITQEYQLDATNDNVSDFALYINQGNIEFVADNLGYYILKIVDAVFILFITISITVLLKRIFLSLDKGNPFITANVDRMRLMAILLMLLTPYSALKSWVYQSYIRNTFTIEGEHSPGWSSFFETSSNSIWLSWQIDIQPLIVGLILIILAEVFRLGVIIKTDNESIV